MAVKSTTLKQNITQYVDTVGNTISLGFTSNLPNFIDSIVVTVVSAQGAVETGATLKSIDTAKQISDTVWYTTAPFASAGIKSINALAFIQENNKDSVKTAINIIDRTHPIVSQRYYPHITVSGLTTIAAGQVCSLSVTVNDSTVGQAHTFYAKQDSLPQAAFTPPFMWTPPAGFTGTSTVVFKVADTDSPSYYDTAMVVITVLAPTSGPHWAKDTVSLTGAAGTALNLTLTDKCTGDSLTFSLADAPALIGDTIINSVYSYTFAANDITTYWPKVIATDKQGKADTMTLHLWATPTPMSGPKALTAFSFTNPAVTGTINESAKTVALTVPYGTDVTALVATFITTGASVKVGSTAQTSGTTANNFTSPITYIVVAIDGSMQAYTVSVTIAANSGKALTAFSFTTPAVTGTINESAKTVALTVPFGTDVTAMVATFTVSSGASVKVGSTSQTSGTTANNFTSPVTYTVVAGDGSTQAYVVTVTIASNTAKALTAFSFTTPAVTGTINESAKTVALTVPYGTDVTALVATFASTGASVKVGSTAQISGTTANNFSSPVTYTVVANDGTTQAYVVTVTVAANTAKALTAFSFTSPAATGTITGTNIAVTVPFGTDVTALVATFASTGASVKVGSTAQISGTTANNFSSPVTYMVVANDGSTQAYVVTVTIAANTAKAMTAFSFTSPAATGTITGTNIAVTVPFGTDVTALIATFTSTGASVKVGSAVQTSGTTTNSFSGPVTYTVVASDGSTQAYVVTVTVAANSGKSITAFSFASLSVTGTINESAKTIAVAVPYNTDVTGLVATFSVSAGASVKIGSAVQTSGTTQNNFSNVVTYTVTAADGSSQAYTVTVTVTPNSAKAITSFSFAGLSPVATGTITGTNIAVTVPYATDVTTLVATFVTTGASVKVGTAVQVSGTTVNDFSKPVSYTIFAADGSAQSYTVTVTVAANTAKAITAFGFTSPAVTGTITGTNIAVTVPYATDVTTLVATFITTGASVKVNGIVQTSGITSSNFSSAVSYVVYAADGSAQTYTVTVTIAPSGAIIIAMQPKDSATCLGSPVSFSVSATGPGTLLYQWKLGTTSLISASATTNTLKIASVATTDVGSYTCIVSNSGGASTTSSAAKLTVNIPVTITTQPSPQSACIGGTASFTVAATGSGLSYQWQNGGANISGATSATYSIASIASSNAGNYTCVITGSCGSVTSNAAALTINNATSISAQPSPQTVCTGGAVSFTVAATGSGTLTYQWQKGGANISGATSPTYSIASIASSNAGNYTCVVTGSCGSATSNAAALTINTTTSITTQPNPQTACIGGTASFTVAATGSGLSYQWQNGGANISGATSPTYSIASIASSNAGNYTCVVTGSCGSVTSNAAALTINTTTSISAQPSPQTVCTSGAASFAVAATGSGTLTYQWQKGGANISGATSATYSIASVASGDAANYTCIVTGGCGSVTSNAAALTINTATSITTQPSPQSACIGAAASFTVAATGAGALTYQWQKSGANISGATSPTYSIASVASSNAGNYACIVTGSCGSVTSNAVALTIKTPVTITNTLVGKTVILGNSASFSITTSGGSNLTYQWILGSQSPIANSNSATYTIPSVSGTDLQNYHCTVRDDCGNLAVSNVVALSGQCIIKYNLQNIPLQPGQVFPGIDTVAYDTSMTMPWLAIDYVDQNGTRYMIGGWSYSPSAVSPDFNLYDTYPITSNLNLYMVIVPAGE